MGHHSHLLVGRGFYRMSNIFTKTELAELQRRLSGKKKDYKIWYRVKPKIEEMLEEWIPHQRKLKSLVEKKIHKR